jgi:hypothetical protein
VLDDALQLLAGRGFVRRCMQDRAQAQSSDPTSTTVSPIIHADCWRGNYLSRRLIRMR